VKQRLEETSKKGDWIHETVLKMLELDEDAFEREI